MSNDELSPTDAAVRARITVPSVHIPCGNIRGPVRRTPPYSPRIWQSCRCEDSPAKWDRADVSRAYDLCVICFRATAGGVSRWSWLACKDCRGVNDAVGKCWGFMPFALGRHSLMNGVGVRGGAPQEVREQQLAWLTSFAAGDDRLRDWRRHEYPRLAASFDPLADIPLQTWQQTHPPSRLASRDALARLIGPGYPLPRPDAR